MVQEFHVVRCFKCQSFQVQQVKEVNKWCCKLCGEKQSLLKEFGRGSAADCRHHVQKLNAMRGAVMEKQEHQVSSPWEQRKEAKEDTHDKVTQDHVSRWSKYLDPPEEADPEDDSVLMDRRNHHSPNFSDRKRKRSYTPEQSRYPGPNPVRPRSLNQANPHILRTTSHPNQKWPRPPSKKNEGVSRTSPFSRWTCFLSSDCPVQEREGPSNACHDVTESTHPLLCDSTMFQSGEDFRLDDKFD